MPVLQRPMNWLEGMVQDIVDTVKTERVARQLPPLSNLEANRLRLNAMQLVDYHCRPLPDASSRTSDASS